MLAILPLGRTFFSFIILSNVLAFCAIGAEFPPLTPLEIRVLDALTAPRNPTSEPVDVSKLLGPVGEFSTILEQTAFFKSKFGQGLFRFPVKTVDREIYPWTHESVKREYGVLSHEFVEALILKRIAKDYPNAAKGRKQRLDYPLGVLLKHVLVENGAVNLDFAEVGQTVWLDESYFKDGISLYEAHFKKSLTFDATVVQQRFELTNLRVDGDFMLGQNLIGSRFYDPTFLNCTVGGDFSFSYSKFGKSTGFWEWRAPWRHKPTEFINLKVAGSIVGLNAHFPVGAAFYRSNSASVSFDHALFEDGLAYIKSTVSGTFDCSNAQFTGRATVFEDNGSMLLNGTTIGGIADFTGSTFKDLVDLSNVSISGELRLKKIRDSGSPLSLKMENIHVDGPATIEVPATYYQAYGAINLKNSTFKELRILRNEAQGLLKQLGETIRMIPGILSLSFPLLLEKMERGRPGLASLGLSAAVVERDFELKNLRIGQLDAPGLKVNGRAEFSRISINPGLFALPKSPPQSFRLDLRDCKFSSFRPGITVAKSMNRDEGRIDGLTFTHLDAPTIRGRDRCNCLLYLLEACNFDSKTYTQLDQNARDAGDWRNSLQIWKKQKKRENEKRGWDKDPLNWFYRAWGWFTDYGRNIAYPFWSMLALFGIAILVFDHSCMKLREPTEGKQEGVSRRSLKVRVLQWWDEIRQLISVKTIRKIFKGVNEVGANQVSPPRKFHPFWYVFELTFPFIDLEVRKYWEPNPNFRFHRWWVRVHIGLCIILNAMLVGIAASTFKN
jgi:hypothetical protein